MSAANASGGVEGGGAQTPSRLCMGIKVYSSLVEFRFNLLFVRLNMLLFFFLGGAPTVVMLKGVRG